MLCRCKRRIFTLFCFPYWHRLYAGPEAQWAVYSSGRSGQRGSVCGQLSGCLSGLFLRLLQEKPMQPPLYLCGPVENP